MHHTLAHSMPVSTLVFSISAATVRRNVIELIQQTATTIAQATEFCGTVVRRRVEWVSPDVGG